MSHENKNPNLPPLPELSPTLQEKFRKLTPDMITRPPENPLHSEPVYRTHEEMQEHHDLNETYGKHYD